MWRVRRTILSNDSKRFYCNVETILMLTYIIQHYIPLFCFAGAENDIQDILESCGKGIDVVREMEQNLYSSGIVQEAYRGDDGTLFPSNPGLIRLESSLLHLGALTNVCLGMFYMVPIVLDDKVVVRYGTKSK